MGRVSIPSELIPLGMDTAQMETFVTECGDLRKQLIEEFSLADLAHRTHGSHKTYLDGCAGPLCTQAHRVYYRNKRNAEPTEYWRIYDPILSSLGAQVKDEVDRAVLRARSEAFRTLADTAIE